MRQLTETEINKRLQQYSDHFDLALLAGTISEAEYERGILEIIQWAEQESKDDHPS